VILSLNFSVVNNIKTEVVGGMRVYRIPFSLVGEVSIPEPGMFRLNNRQVMQDELLQQIHDLLELEFAERVIESNPESGNGTGQDQEASPAVGGPDRQNVQGESRGPRPVQRTTAANAVYQANYGGQNGAAPSANGTVQGTTPAEPSAAPAVRPARFADRDPGPSGSVSNPQG